MAAPQRPGWVLYLSLALLALFVGAGVRAPVALAALGFTQEHFGWFYLFATTGFLVYCVGVALSSYGSIRLGADGEALEFACPAWLGMIFSAGMGVGLVFWSAAQLWILGGVAVVFLLCALTPLEQGVRHVSNANMWLAAGILLFVFVAGPTDFITAAATNAIGEYFGNVIGMSLV